MSNRPLIDKSLRDQFLASLAAVPPVLSRMALLAIEALAAETGQRDSDSQAKTRQAETQLEAFVAQARAAGADAGPRELTEFVRTTLGFKGNSSDYYHADNSDLGEVIASRQGIPITLAILYLELARQLGLDAQGIGFPGHFLVGFYSADRTCTLVDPFTSEIVTQTQCLARLEALPGGRASLARASDTERAHWFLPASAEQIALRLLENLKQIHLRGSAAGPALAVLSLQLAIDPDNIDLRSQHEQLVAHIFGRDTDPQVH